MHNAYSIIHAHLQIAKQKNKDKAERWMNCFVESDIYKYSFSFTRSCSTGQYKNTQPKYRVSLITHLIHSYKTARITKQYLELSKDVMKIAAASTNTTTTNTTLVRAHREQASA
jgi:valyl-tRNA synthetase